MDIMEKLSSKENQISIIGFIISLSLIIIENIVSENIMKLSIYLVTYVLLVLNLLYINKFKVMSIPILFTIFHILFVGGCPLFVAIRRHEFYSDQYNLILISYLLFCLANFVSENFVKQNEHGNERKEKVQIYSKTLKFLSIAMIITGILAEIIYLYSNRNILFGGNLEDGRIIATQGNGILVHAMSLGTMGIGILFELMLDKKISKKIFIPLLLVVAIFSLMTGFRSRILAIIVILVLIYNKKRKIDIKKIFIIGMIGILILIVLGVVRDELSGNNDTGIINTLYATLENGSVNLEKILGHFPENTKYQHGYTYLINVIMLKPGPDPDFTLWLKETMNMNFSGGGVTPTLVGEFYINFGNLGVYIGFILFGFLASYLNRKYEKAENAYYISILVWCFTGTLRGGIGNVEINLLIYTLVYIIVMYLAKKIDISKINIKGRKKNVV